MAASAAPEDDDGPRRKGRGNAILTYETVADLAQKLTRVDGKLDAVLGDLRRQEADHTDHEGRLRRLEEQMTGILAATAAAATARTDHKRDFQWVWGGLMTATSVVLAVLTYLNKS